MAEKSSFFTSLNGDRKYKSTDFAEYFSSFIGNGVFPNPSTNLQVLSNNDMTITVKSGKAWINGYYYNNTDDLILSVEYADGVLNRIDRVVIRLDSVNREISTKIKKGVFSSSPIEPVLQRDADAYEICIASVLVNNGSISISQSNIIDTRMDTELCGMVNSLIKVDSTILTDKLERDFYDWLDTIQGVLDEDTAGNLLNRIIKLEENVNNMELTDTNITVTDTNNHFNSPTLNGVLDEIYINIRNLNTQVNGSRSKLIEECNKIINLL